MKDWPVVKLNYCFNTIGSGTTPSTTLSSFYDGEIPWVTTSELRETVIEETQKHISKDAFDDHSALKLYPEGSLAIAMYGATIGRLGILGVPATVNQACCVFAEPINTDIKFIYYYLQAAKEELLLSARGGGQPNLSQNDLRKLRLTLPPLPTQKAIARHLDERTARIDALIEKKQRLLTLLAERRAALITRAVTRGLEDDVELKDSGVEWLGEIPVGWEVKRLRFLVETNPSKSEIKLPFHKEVSFFAMEDIGEDGSLNHSTTRSIESVVTGYTYFRNGDLSVAKITPCFENGKGAIMKDLVGGIGFGTTELHILRANDSVTTGYLSLIVSSRPFRNIGESMMYGAGGQKRISDNFIKDFQIGLPDVQTQIEILDGLSNLMNNLERVELKTQSSLHHLQEYRSALITAAVNGELNLPTA